MEYTIIQELSQSNNTTQLIRLSNGDKAVRKQFKLSKGADIEAAILARMSVTGYAPKILEQGDGYLINEYIEGITAYEEFQSLTMSDDREGLGDLADMLAIYLQIFYSMNDDVILRDINLKNFIIMDGRCYGIDYDKVGEGMQYTDVAGLIANAAVATVGEVYGCLPFVERVLKNFHLQIFDVINEVREYLEAYSVDNPTINVDSILSSLIVVNDDKILDILKHNNGR